MMYRAISTQVAAMILTAALVLHLTGDIGHAQGNAGQAGEFLRWGTGAKAMGLGRAFTSISDDASALYWNPAGMSALRRTGGTFMFMHMPLREGASLNYLAGAVPVRLFFVGNPGTSGFVRGLQDLKLGVGVLWHSLGEFQLFDNAAVPQSGGASAGTSTDQSAVYVSASYPLNSLLRRSGLSSKSGFGKIIAGDLDVGLTAKFIQQDLFGVGLSATSFDLGFKYAHESGFFNLGFTWRDLNQPTFSRTANVLQDKIPANAVLGVSVSPALGYLNGLMLSFDYGVVAPAGREQEVMFGLEYDFSRINSEWPVKLRLGSNSNHESITFGLNFSPEILLGRDWLPSADWTYGNDRSSFDATGARYSFSVDRNPFTSRYWYQAAMAELQAPDCHDLYTARSAQQALTFLRYSETSKNTGKRAYRYEAALRSADVRFLSLLREMQETQLVDDPDPESRADRFRSTVQAYTNRARRFMRLDAGKKELDREAYFRSFLFAMQAGLLANEPHESLAALESDGKSWGKNLAVTTISGTSATARRTLDYLKAYALYKDGRKPEAIRLVSDNLNEHQLGKFLLAHIFFLEGEYQEVLQTLQEVDLNTSAFPADLYLPLTTDCSFGDEVLFLRAASMYYLSSPEESREFLNEFAKIPRFFPDSDFAAFLTNGQTLLTGLVESYQAGDFERLAKTMTRITDAYIRAFSTGTVIHDYFSLNTN